MTDTFDTPPSPTPTTEPVDAPVEQTTVPEVETAVVNEPPTVIEPEPMPVIETAPLVPVTIAQPEPTYLDIAKEYRKNGTIVQTSFMESLNDFVTAMKPGHFLSEQDGMFVQTNFLNALEYVLESHPTGTFKRYWQAVLAVVAENSGPCGCFNERSVLRYVHKFTIDKARLDRYVIMLTLLIISSDSTKRNNLKQYISMEKLLALMPSENVRRNLQSAYN